MDNVPRIPTCVGIVMDGNRRWAEEHALPTLEGHRRGHGALRSLVDALYTMGIPHVVCYAFSTENWNRAEHEVHYLMELMQVALSEFSSDVQRAGLKINIHIVGERLQLSQKLQDAIQEAESHNSESPRLTLWIMIAYGGRAEIVRAVNRAIEEGKPVTEATFSEMLLTNGMPDPDLIIRTSGEKRLSNFLLWQSAYSELFFTETLWPDFGETEFKSIVEEYGKRQRRHGA